MSTRMQKVGLSLNLLDNTEVYQLVLETKTAVAASNKSLKTETYYTRAIAELDTLLPQFKAQLHKTKKSEVSEKLEAADMERDAVFTTLKKLISSYRRLNTSDHQEAYKALSKLLSNYQNLISLSYEKETESINHLLSSLATEPYQAHLNRLHLTTIVTQLTQAQKAFEQAYQARMAETEVKPSKNLRQLRQELLASYALLVDFTLTYSAAYPELVAYQKLAERLNTIRLRFKNQQTKKKTKTEDSPQGSDQPTTD